jgi:hypothetical protein
MIIYKITNLINNKIYVGKDKNDDPKYYGSGILIKKAIKKYGKQNFKKKIIEQIDNIKLFNEKEVYWIKKLNSKVPNGYNLTDGGDGVINPPKNIIKKMIRSLKKTYKNQEIRRKCGDWERGKTYDELYGKEKSKLLKKQKSILLTKNNPTKNPIVRKKINKKRRGKKYEDFYGIDKAKEIKLKVSKSLKGMMKGKTYEEIYGKHGAELQKEKLRKFRIGKTWESIYGKEKSDEMKKNRSNLMIGNKLYLKRK